MNPLPTTLIRLNKAHFPVTVPGPQKYAGQPVTLIGMEFSHAERNLVGFEWRRLP